jgi:hypothetical protein
MPMTLPKSTFRSASTPWSGLAPDFGE